MTKCDWLTIPSIDIKLPLPLFQEGTGLSLPDWLRHEEIHIEDKLDEDCAREAALIDGFRSGGEPGLEALIQEYKEPLHRFIYRNVRDEEETADILSQTFIKAWRNRDRYQPKAKLKTWLFTIAANLCRDLARKRKRRPGDFAINSTELHENQEPEVCGHAGLTSPSDNVSRNEEADFLHQAIGELPHDLKTAVILCSLEDHSHEEAALIAGCTPKAIETRIYRAKKQLRKKLSGVLGEN